MVKRSIVLYLHVHQPFRLRPYSVFDIANSHDYFNDSVLGNKSNYEVIQKIAHKSYRPMNALLLKLLNRHPEFKLSLSITGTFIEEAKQWAPDVIESFKRLVDTGRVEIVAETYYHSLAFFYDKKEFEAQVDAHRNKIKEVFGVETNCFRNTELSYNDDLAKWADDYGFKGIITEGWEHYLEWRSPNMVYTPYDTKNIKLLMKNYRMSDDLAFRFGEKTWSEFPMTADKYNSWAHEATNRNPLLNLFMDYETFGEHQWEDTGIFEFFEDFVGKWLSNPENNFETLSSAIDNNEVVAEISIPHTVTWADTERDLSAWLGNSMQQEALNYLYRLGEDIMRTDDLVLISDWRKLQTSDHVYYMCTKWFKDGDVHAYFSPYESPYDAFLYFMNAVRDLRWRLHVHHRTGGLHG